MASADRDHGFLGYLALKKTAGQGTPAVGQQTNLMFGAVNPRNPNNIIYPSVVNKAGAASVRILGAKTPSIRIAGIPGKLSWLTPAFLNSLIILLDAANNSDEFGIGVHDGTGLRVYDGAKCAQVSIYHTAGGGVFIDLDFICRYGDNEAPVPTTFSTPSTDGGDAYGSADFSYNSTASEVDLWRLTIQRGQAFNKYSDGTRYSDVIQSGMAGGVITLQQSPNAATVPTTAMTIDVGASTTGVRFSLALSEDEAVKDVMPALLAKTRSYSLFNSSGALGVVIAARP